MFRNIVLFAHKNGQKKSGVEKTPYILQKFIENDSKQDLSDKRGNIYGFHTYCFPFLWFNFLYFALYEI